LAHKAASRMTLGYLEMSSLIDFSAIALKALAEKYSSIFLFSLQDS
jgi:hypothetical protein